MTGDALQTPSQIENRHSEDLAPIVEHVTAAATDTDGSRGISTRSPYMKLGEEGIYLIWLIKIGRDSVCWK